MLENGIIRRSNSNYINPIVIVIKKGGSVRLCLDARELNRRLEEDRECPPGIEEIFKKCRNVLFISNLDLTASFWQVRLAEKYRKYTAFIINGRVYEFCVVPFGLAVSTSALLRALDVALAECESLLCLSENLEQHIEHLRTLFQKNERTWNHSQFQKVQFCPKRSKIFGTYINS